MWHRFLTEARFFNVLLDIDRDLAAEARDRGCECGGRLHSARYWRKPRGGPDGLDDDHSLRFSFCCAREGCRRRVTPPSVRFLGRKVYYGAVVVLVTAMLHGPSPHRIATLGRLFGVGWKTINRWRGFWQSAFAESPFWRTSRGRFARPVDTWRLPYSLHCQFGGDNERRLVCTLKFIIPVTTTSAWWLVGLR